MGPKANPKGAKGSKREARRDPSFKPRAWLEKGEAKGAKRCRKGCPRKPKGEIEIEKLMFSIPVNPSFDHFLTPPLARI